MKNSNSNLFVEFKCDNCGTLIKRYASQTKLDGFHFCSRNCQHKATCKGGILSDQIKQTCVKKYGVNCTLYSVEAKEKTLKTVKDRYNVLRPCDANSVEQIKLKKRKTCKQKYGSEIFYKSKRFKEKYEITSLKNWGVTNPMRSNIIKQRVKDTCVKIYGSENIFAVKEIQDKIQETLIKKYGVKNAWVLGNKAFQLKYGVANPTQLEWVRQKIVSTNLAKFGVDNVFKSQLIKNLIKDKLISKYSVDCVLKHGPIRSKIDYSKVSQIARETMKRNKTYCTSKPKEKMFSILCEMFGVSNVQRQVPVNGWRVDFYVASGDFYVQVDGVYWHGLKNHSRNTLTVGNNSPRALAIIGTALRDQKQNEWFVENNLTLVRITDIEINYLTS